MFLGKRGGRTRSLDTYFSGREIKQLDKVELEKVVSRYKNGEDLADVIITSHIKLAIKIAGRYSTLSDDDAVSAAMFGLVQAVKWLPTRLKDMNATPYITTTIHRFLFDAHDLQDTVHIPRNKKAEIIPIKFETNHDLDIFRSDDEYNEPDTIVLSYKDESDMSELFDQMSLTVHERCVLKYRIEGFLFREIAEKLDCSKISIVRLFNVIEDKARRAGFNYETKKRKRL